MEEEKKIETVEEVKEEKPKKEKKPCKLCSWFRASKNPGGLIGRALLILLVAIALSYLFLLVWGLIDKLVVTFFYGVYCALGTAGVLLVAAIVLIILLIVDYNKKK